jgi:DNA-binding MurR/RpiR family transcriptional regulator
MSIREDLANTSLVLTSAESKIVQALLDDYPMSGLSTATRLAGRAGVSDPTVTRLMIKLGYSGFAEFQSKLLAEVEARLLSPLLMLEVKRPPPSGEVAPALAYFHSIADSLERTKTAVPSQSYVRAVQMLLECKGQVYLLGGRFSRHVASMLAAHLIQLRPGIRDLGALTPADFDLLIDMGKRDLLVVFDYRRYQSDVVDFAQQAHRHGVEILLFTDPSHSPIADIATLTMVATTDALSPFDTLTTAVAQVEAICAHALESRGQPARRRIEEIEAIRRANAVTLDIAEPPDPAAASDSAAPTSAKPRSAKARKKSTP